MDEVALREGERVGGRRLEGELLPSGSGVFARLRELTRNGYVPDSGSDDEGGAILLRHASGPDLLLRPDGSIDIPTGQAAKAPGAAPAPARRRMSRGRTLMVIVLAAVFWFLSLFLTALFVSG